MTATVDTPRTKLRRLITQIDIDEQCRKRAVQQAILHASAWWWCWRAEQFDWARPRPNDFHGNISTGEKPGEVHTCNAACRARLAEAYQRCMDTAIACRRKAAFLEWEAGEPLIDPVTGEAASD